MRKINKIIIHHSGKNKGDAKSIKKLHTTINKWDDIGYHFIINNGSLKEDGLIEKGRDIKIIGAHAKNFNKDSVGICLIGNFDISKPTKNQLDSLIYLLKNLKKEFDIDIDNIITHNNVNQEKSCPGKNFKVNRIKKELVDSLEEFF